MNATKHRSRARRQWVISFILTMAAITAAAAGYLFHGEIILACLGLNAMATLFTIGAICMAIEALESGQAANREEYWENRFPAKH